MPSLFRPTASRLSRRGFLTGAAALSGAGALAVRSSRSEPAFPPSKETHAFKVHVDLDATGTRVNRRVLGSNVGWAFGGDGLVRADGSFAPNMIEMVRRLAPTVLRYPGGTFSDVFHWEAPRNEHVFTRQAQPTLMDTQRFLEVCEAVGAEPLITVNVVTGTAEEAARWVRATNVSRMESRVTGKVLPRVKFWEIGNEPYLQEQSRSDIDLKPEEFARRVDQFIPAMRSVDPGISIGLPLTSDTRAGIPVTPYQGFARKVLARIEHDFDYACLHNAYMPFGYKRGMAAEELYWGAAAGALTVQSDFAAMTRLLEELRPGRKIPLAVTEYNAIFTLGRGETDKWITSPAGAIFVADVLRVFSQTPNLLLATHWSLSANWLFGAIHEKGYARPAFEVLRLVGEALHGELIPARVQAPTVAVKGIGQVESRDAMPLIEAMATRALSDNNGIRTVRVLLINKDPQRAAQGVLPLTAANPVHASLSVLSSSNLFSADDLEGAMARSEITLEAKGGLVPLRLPAHSVALLSIQIPQSK